MGQSGDRKSYRVILLLVVGLTAFSSAMKELNLLREFSRETSDLVASWSKAVVPEAPQAPVTPEAVVPVPVPQVSKEVCCRLAESGRNLSGPVLSARFLR